MSSAASSTTKGWRELADAELGYESLNGAPSGKRYGSRLSFTKWLAITAGVITTLWLVSKQYQPVQPRSPRLARPSFANRPHTVWDRRAEEVRAAFVHAYHDYERFAFPKDELLPLVNKSKDNFNGWGVTALDSLDTMYIMELDDELDRAIAHLKELDILSTASPVPFFETVIRYLGGFLAAWHLTGDPLLLHRADQLGTALLPAFGTPSGFPAYSITPKSGASGPSWQGVGSYSLAESATCQMEYKYLAYLTGRPEYYEVAEKVMDGLTTLQNSETHMWAQLYYGNGETLNPSRAQYSMGAGGDSAYEYLLKQYLLTGRSETHLLDLYLSSVRGVIMNLLYVSKRGLLYITDVNYSNAGGKQILTPSGDLEHLSCFFPGLLALGAHTLNNQELSAEERELHLALAKGLGTTCYLAYAETDTGLGPEVINFGREDKRWVDAYRDWQKDGKHGTAPGFEVDVKLVKDRTKHEYATKDDRWLCRPETLESIFLLWRVTGDVIWRERGYEIFKAIENVSRAPVAYTSIKSVDTAKPTRLNEMPSFFLAETLKYLYLLFRDDDAGISLDHVVFNTEAHPLPVFHWNEMEKISYRIGQKPRQHLRSLMDMIAVP